MKLSNHQREILDLLKQGHQITTAFFSNGSPTTIAGKRISDATFDKLSNLNLIVFDRQEISKMGVVRNYYKLSS